ncbi:MAG: glutathione-disulfide reductase [Gammaproteobacteria bacterium]
MFDFDLLVIGAGSGGVRAARMAAGFGARVAIVESGAPGGTCVNAGCIPKKLFTYAAHAGADLHDARGYGWRAEALSFDWPTLRANKDAEIQRLNGIYERLLSGAGVTIVAGRARLDGPQAVEVGGRRLRAERLLVATGGRPRPLAIPGGELAITSDDAFHLERLPARIVIVGGGYIAVEFAGIFHGLGVRTTLVHRGDPFLRGFDDELRTGLAREMRREGIGLEFGAQPERIERAGQGLVLHLADGRAIHADAVMSAIGRLPNVDDLGLETAGVRTGASGAIVVDREYRSSAASVYAIGDVTDRMNLTPVALAEAMAFARRVYGGQETEVDYEYTPTAVFSQPNIATVGPTEAQARARYPQMSVFTSTFTPLRHTLTGRGEKTFMKLLVDGRTDRVVAAHMLGADAGEIIQGLAVAIRAGATKAVFDSTIGIHPTAAEEFVTLRTATR